VIDIEVGRTARKPNKKQLLTPAMKQERLTWANKLDHGQLMTGRRWLSVMNHIFVVVKGDREVLSDEAVMNL
jgi:hypothetical protein